jgi:hypothetical protein
VAALVAGSGVAGAEEVPVRSWARACQQGGSGCMVRNVCGGGEEIRDLLRVAVSPAHRAHPAHSAVHLPSSTPHLRQCSPSHRAMRERGVHDEQRVGGRASLLSTSCAGQRTAADGCGGGKGGDI